MKRFALIGNPNCGKTTLFNALTGSTAHVGNWPGVTVDKKTGVYKKCKENVEIIDLPGIYSLSPYTPEEVISRNYILDEKPECVINIIDSTNLERNLYLTTQLLEIDVPVVIALNMYDIIRKNGISLDPDGLAKSIGVPVLCISASKNEGIEELMEEAYTASLSKREGTSVLKSGALGHLINDVRIAFEALGVTSPLFHAVKLVENDELELENHKELVNIVSEFKKTFNDDVFGNDLEAIVADERYKYISANYSKYKIDNSRNEEKLTKSDKIDKVLTHKWAGIPIFLCVLFAIFHLTFSENLFYLGGLFSNVAPSFEGSMFEGLFWTDGGINSPGVILFNLVDCLTAGLSEVIAGWFDGAPGWIAGLVNDGIVAGVFAVLSFVPQILLLFLFFSILEDSGYMARVAFILDRIFRRFGLTGRAFMPMIMGFGCSVPAMINTRTLADEKERTATIRVIPFFSCGAKLPILTAIAGGICQIFGFANVDLITYSMYIVGILVAIITVIIMRSTSMRGAVAPFIMELPEYHAPGFKMLMLHLWDKLKHYVKKAFTIILASTIVIWFLQSFTWNWKFIEQADVSEIAAEAFDECMEDSSYSAVIEAEFGSEVAFEDVVGAYLEIEDETEAEAFYATYLSDVFKAASVNYANIVSDKDYVSTTDSILAGIGQFASPLFTPIGCGSQLNDNGWVYPVAAVTGLIAKENVISTFGVLAACTNENVISEKILNAKNDEAADLYSEIYFAINEEEGIQSSIQMIENTDISWPALIAFIVFNMTTIPCFAAVATAKGELGKKKLLPTLVFWIVTSFVSASVVYLVLSWWWLSFVIAALAVASAFAIRYHNKYQDSKAVLSN